MTAIPYAVNVTNDKKTQALQIRIGNGERALSKETYRAIRMAAIDEGKSLGQIIEEAWAARLLQNKAELLAGSSGEGAGPARR